MHCPSCRAKRTENISFFKSNTHFCKKCSIIFTVEVTELNDMQHAIVQTMVNAEKKKRKIINDKSKEVKA